MKQFYNSFILSLLAVSVFLTGTGVTIMDYCCSVCGKQSFYVAGHICGEHKSQQINEDKTHCCSGTVCDDQAMACNYTADKHCSASRISFDLDSSMSRPHIATPFVWLPESVYTFFDIFSLDVDIDYKEHIETPPKIPPRSYLSLIRVLII